jgi:hypothetical protein
LRQHRRFGLETDDPQAPHPATAGARVGQSVQIRRDGRSAFAECVGIHIVVAAGIHVADEAGLWPRLQFHQKATNGARRDGPDIGCARNLRFCRPSLLGD